MLIVEVKKDMSKRKKDEPEIVTMTELDMSAFKDRIRNSSLSESDVTLIVNILNSMAWIKSSLSKSLITIASLKKLFGFKSTEKNPGKEKSDDKGNNETAENEAEPTSTAINSEDTETSQSAPEGSEPSDSSANSIKKPTVRDPNANHGRLSVADYVGCPKVTINHEELKYGDPCPDCTGKLNHHPAGVMINLVGTPLISGETFEVEKLRCNACQTIFAAEVPSELKEADKYAASCGTNIALGRYGFGLPFKRLETWQSYAGVPLPDSTQWHIIKKLHVTVKPLHDFLIDYAAQGNVFHFDDTPNRILTANSPFITRKGVYTTAISSDVDAHRVVLFFTGGQYGSENVMDVLSHRDADENFATMSDASANNLPRGAKSDLLEKWILCFCLVHGRRKFFDIFESFKEACGFVLKQIETVYINERYCKDNNLSADERLVYHQENSGPAMASLHVWLKNQWQFRMTEHNSTLGNAIAYMLRHWVPLTKFLEVPGVPIDNSLAERLIKVAIRHRRNSLFYKTNFGAKVGDCFMSIIQTAAGAGANVYEYLNALQRYGPEVSANPQDWLPWNYQKTVEAMAIDKAA